MFLCFCFFFTTVRLPCAIDQVVVQINTKLVKSHKIQFHSLNIVAVQLLVVQNKQIKVISIESGKL